MKAEKPTPTERVETLAEANQLRSPTESAWVSLARGLASELEKAQKERAQAVRDMHFEQDRAKYYCDQSAELRAQIWRAAHEDKSK